MKKMFILATTVVLVLMLGVCAGYAQPMGPGMMGPGYGYGPSPEGGGNYCPYCGNYIGPGPGYGMGYSYGGMMGRGYGGYGMGPGMMGRGWGGYGMMGPGYYSYGPRYGYGGRYQQPQKPLDKDQARQEVENYLNSKRNPNLKMGKIEDKGNAYEVDIETKDGSLVNKILVDKDTGRMRSAY